MSAKDQFFQKMERLGRWLTFDDVRLKTGYSQCMPDQVSLETKFSRRVPLKIPIVSAAMDTVTEKELAIALALLGGLGVIHRGLSPEEQAQQVARVKFHLNGLIEKPICVRENQTIETILKRREEKSWNFHSFPVVNGEGKLVGVLTHRDFLFCQDVSLPAGEVMTREVITCPQGTSIDQAYQTMCDAKRKVLPLVNQEKHIVGLYVFSDLHRIKSGSSSGSNIDDKGQLRVGAAIGTGEEALKRARLLVHKRVDVLVIDTAHADSEPVFETLRSLKRKFPGTDIVVGNVSAKKSAERLARAEADGIKVGQGPGSTCTTRIIAGIGAPQVTAIYNCSQIADQYEIPLCADGGIRYSGDIAIAIGAGARNVMLGNLLAGTEEAAGETIMFEGRQWKPYRGMGSLGALKAYRSSRERYRQEDDNPLIPEGIEGLVPYRGALKDVLSQYLGGLRQGMGYVGASSIDELREKADFVFYSSQNESHPSVRITKKSPNYF